MTTMHDVESTNIAAIGYDELQKELHVRFKGGPTTYVYHDVPRDAFDELMRSESKGANLSQRIKGVYTFTKLEEAPKDLLTMTMTRPIFEALQEMLAGHGANNMTLTETSPGVAQLEVVVLRDEGTEPPTDSGGKLSHSQE